MKNLEIWLNILVFLGGCLLCGMTSALPIHLKQLNVQPDKNKVRIILAFDKPLPLKAHSLNINKKNQLIITFKATKLTIKTDQIKYNHYYIRSIQAIQDHQNLKLIFHLKQKPSKIYTQQFFSRATYYLAIRLSFNDPQKTKPQLKTPRVSASNHSVVNPSSSFHQSKKNKKNNPSSTLVTTKSQFDHLMLRDAIVVIDPGHGGKDPGALGYYKTREKDVVLKIAKKLFARLKNHPGIQPELTRSGDYFVPLRGRLRRARKNTTDLFISIHADAYRHSRARGVSVFALSQHGATSEAAQWLAKRENHSELMGGVDLDGKSHVLRSILIDLSQTATIRESLYFGNDLLAAMKKIARPHTGWVEQAPFMVLKSPDIPSILAEVGFISNRYEERLLREEAYQNKVAQALEKGIVDYLRHHPPQNTVWTH